MNEYKTIFKMVNLKYFRKNLQIGRIDYGVEGEEFVEFTTAVITKVINKTLFLKY